MAWSIGSNDVANSMATAVGAKAITFRQAVLIAGVLNVVGAVFVGSHVTDTVRKGIVDVNSVNIDSQILLIGFVASLLSAAIWVTLSTWKEMPVSTTHSIIGSLMGFGLIAGGVQVVMWGKVGSVIASWVISPLAGCIIAFIVFKIIVKTIFSKEYPVKSARIVGPIIFGFTALLIVSSLFLKTSLSKNYGISDLDGILIAIIATIIVVILGIIGLRNIKDKGPEDYQTVEGIFRKLQVGTSCYVAFAHGANDVANAIGPVASIVPLAQGIEIGTTVEVPTWLLLLGGIGIAVGCMTWGRRVMKTVGSRITSLTNTRGFSVDFGAATTVLIASKMGLPISTSHTVVGAVIGVGLARGLEAVDLSVIKRIVASWLLTLPIAAGTCIVIFFILRAIFGI
ncbi:phosphate permease [Thermoplasmatales archaeon SG8-52-4]|nr:MAG: phosphate permease [Thermoplasmatales archaeon SG8-52-4]